MKTYLVITTSHDKWEIIGGQYIVQAEDPEKARDKVKEFVDKSIVNQEIISIWDLEKVGIKKVFEINSPIVE